MRDAIRCRQRQLGEASISWSKLPPSAAAVLLGMGFTNFALAQSVPVMDAPVSCQDRFRLDRRDNPQNAIRNFRQCNAMQDVSTNIENLTFWYVTLPASPQSKQDFRFETVWRNNLNILTGQFVGLKPDKAYEILDAGIVRGLKRGKRQDLIERWLATHDAAVFAATQPAGVQTHVANEAAAPPITPAPPEKSTVTLSVAAHSKPDRPRRVERVHQVQRNTPPPDRYTGYGSPNSDDLNRAQLGNVGYAPAVPPVSRPYEVPMAPAYVPVVQQQPFPQPSAAPQVPVQLVAPQPQQFYYPSIPQQVEKNIRTVAELIEENIRTVQQAFFGPPPRR